MQRPSLIFSAALLGLAASALVPPAARAQDVTSAANVVFSTADANGNSVISRLNADGTVSPVNALGQSEVGLSSSGDNNVYFITGGDSPRQLALSTGALAKLGQLSSADLVSLAVPQGAATVYALSLSNGIIAIQNSGDHPRRSVANNFGFTPFGLALDAAGNFYISGESNIVRLKPDGRGGYVQTTLASGISTLTSFCAAPDGSGVYFSDEQGAVHRAPTDGSGESVVFGTHALAILPSALACDPAGNVYLGGLTFDGSSGTDLVSRVYRYTPASGAFVNVTPAAIPGYLLELTLVNTTAGGVNRGVTVGVETTQFGSKTNPDGVFTITRTGDATGKLKVAYAMKGKAVNGVDYQMVKGTVRLKAGEAAATVTIHPLHSFDTPESVKLVIQAGTGYTPDPNNKKATTYLGE